MNAAVMVTTSISHGFRTLVTVNRSSIDSAFWSHIDTSERHLPYAATHRQAGQLQFVCLEFVQRSSAVIQVNFTVYRLS